MKPETSVKIYISIGSIIVILCAVFAGCFGLIFNSILNNILIISEDGAIYDQYVSPDVPIYMDFYMFNVLNPKEVQYYGAKPELEELGPYRYLEVYQKRDVEFSDDGNTVSYYQDRTYYFQEDMSAGSESDLITTINPIMVIIAGLLYDNPLLTQLLWPEIEKGMDLFETHTVGELTYSGWDLPEFNFDFSDTGIPSIPDGPDFNSSLLSLLQNLDDILDKTSGINGTLYDILSKVSIDIPYLEPNKIGIFYMTNRTDDGYYTVNTGKGGLDTYLYIQEWENDTRLHFWNDTYCDMLNGSDGTQFPPGFTHDIKRIELFTSDLCRSLYLDYEREIDVQDVIKTYKYSAPKGMLDSPNNNPDNECYCITPLPTDTEEDCFDMASMLNMAPCSAGVPVVLSTPHFYNGNQRDVDYFIGLNPDKDHHETYLNVEPVTGLVAEAAKRIQVNVAMRKYSNLPSFRNVIECAFPMFWADENYKLEQDDADALHKVLTLPFIIIYSICGVLILVGICLIIVGLVKMSKLKKTRTV